MVILSKPRFRSSVSPQYYYDLEKGRRRLNIDLIIQLADYFQVSIDYLLGRNTEDLVGENIFSDLSESVKKEIVDFVEFIRQKYKNE
jgi:transcriptional regulator with XRE-family HTH domain